MAVGFTGDVGSASSNLCEELGTGPYVRGAFWHRFQKNILMEAPEAAAQRQYPGRVVGCCAVAVVDAKA